MTWTLEQVVDRSTTEGIEPAEATQIANQRYQELVRRSGFLRATVSIGTTDGTTTDFALPAAVARVLAVKVTLDDGSVVRYPNRIGTDDFDALVASDLESSQNSYAEDFDANGGVQLCVYPAPEAGTLYARVTKVPDELVNDADELIIPDEFVQGLLDGIKAVVFRDMDEDVQAAQALEASFESAVEKLSDYTKSQVVGVGPMAIPMRGVNW